MSSVGYEHATAYPGACRHGKPGGALERRQRYWSYVREHFSEVLVLRPVMVLGWRGPGEFLVFPL